MSKMMSFRMMTILKYLKPAHLLFLLSFIFANQAVAELNLEITRGSVEPLPIAISEFHTTQDLEREFAREVNEIITNDLQSSGLFRPLDPKSFLQNSKALLTFPRFEDWKVINAQALVSGTVQKQSTGKMRVEFRLWDVLAGQQMTGFVYTVEPEKKRRVAHMIADAIYKRLTGEDGYFDTKIVYIAETGTPLHRTKRLAVMDQDGANHKFMTNGDKLVLTPRFSPNMHKVAYMAYNNNDPRVYVFDLATGENKVLGDFPGMTFAPRFSPDNNHVVMSFARAGKTNIYEMNLKSKAIHRLTNAEGISTSPSYSPDGSQIVFSSDRGGSQQIYVMDRNGENTKRISFEAGNYANPVWSPRGDLIAFIKIYAGKFAIGVMRPDGTGERILTESYHAEGPSWAPNGRTILFFKEESSLFSESKGRNSKLYMIDLTGYNEREVKIPNGGSDPAWSPLIR